MKYASPSRKVYLASWCASLLLLLAGAGLSLGQSGGYYCSDYLFTFSLYPGNGYSVSSLLASAYGFTGTLSWQKVFGGSPYCPSVAVPSDQWISILTQNASGTSGQTQFTIAPNPSPLPRNSSILVSSDANDATPFSISQAGSGTGNVPITYTFTGIASGTLGNNSFNNAQFTVTSFADASQVTYQGSTYQVQAGGSFISIAGQPLATFTDPTNWSDEQGPEDIVFGDSTTGAGLLGITVFGQGVQTYNLESSFGPVSSPVDFESSIFHNFQNIATSEGPLTLISSNETFTASLLPANTTATALVSTANPVNYGQSISLVASVSPSAATGTVTFYDGSASLGTAPLIGGYSTLPLSAPTSGWHSLSAVYNGDVNHAVSTGLLSEQVFFADVPPDAYYAGAVDLLSEKGITAGCGNNDYCPGATVTRDQMAIFLVRTILGDGSFSYSPIPHFDDVPSTYFAFPWIQKLYELGVTGGCSGTPMLFCPTATVTRDQMAIFIIRARYGTATAFTSNPTPFFSDVPSSYYAFDWIQRLYQDGITAGCNLAPLEYCPGSPVSRGDMAIFLMRGGFNQLLPPTEPIITSISPSTLTAGTSGTFTITGANTNFLAISCGLYCSPGTQLVFAPNTGITVSTLSVTSPTSLQVTLVAAPDAPLQPVSIYEQTEPQEAVLPNGLTIQ